DCSDIDDVIVFTRDGRYVITKVSDKAFFDKNILYIGVFKRNDERTIYNVLYRDGKNGPILMKRCAIKGITRDKEYNITKGDPRSEILYMSVNPNGEAEVLKIYFKPRPRLKKVIVDLDFSTIAIKGRQSQGNLFSRYGIHKIVLKERGASTLGGQQIWYDEDVRRLNADGRGELLGEFQGDDRLIVWTARNLYYITNYDLTQHFPDDTVRVSRYRPEAVYAVVYFDRTQNYHYLKRFCAERSEKMQPFLDEESEFVAISETPGSRLRLVFGGAHASRAEESVEVDTFIGVKSHRAKGKRLSTYRIAEAAFVEPAPEPEEESSAPESGEPAAGAAVERPQGRMPETDGNVVSSAEEDETEQLNLF
ncbi:MAG: DNA gyrase/topoisomerase IV subunit A, partial [Alistipes sp.]|nr:DNA gyrase/topoisomerase IV subunit A [Alistipes sp.]